MATKAERAKAEAAIANSEKHRKDGEKKGSSRHEQLKAANHKSKTGHALHGKTKLQADAKAGKPDVGLDGGEARTGGAPVSKTKSRKSTRRGLPGGEKPSSEKRAVIMRTTSPEARAARGK